MASRAPTQRHGRLSRKSLLIVVGSLIAAAGAAGVLAYFTATGHGAGAAASGTADDVTLSAGTPQHALHPGGSADVAVTVSNPNVVSVRLPSLELDTGGVTVDGGHAGCDVAKLHYAAQDNGGNGYDVPAGVSTLDLPSAISMDTDAASACQGATFTVYLKVGS